MVDVERLAEALANIAQTLITEYEVSDVLHELCDDTAKLLAVTGAGVMLTDERDGVLRFAAANDERSALVEHLQLGVEEGPCLRATADERPVIVDDLAHSSFFPRFAPLAVDEGMCGVAAFPMRVHGRTIGALTLYRDHDARFADDEADAAQTLAASATAYVLNARALDSAVTLSQQLQHALDNRVVIEQAKGKLCAELGVEPRAAFELLRGHARRNGAKVRDVAEEVMQGRLALQLGPSPGDAEIAQDAVVPTDEAARTGRKDGSAGVRLPSDPFVSADGDGRLRDDGGVPAPETAETDRR